MKNTPSSASLLRDGGGRGPRVHRGGSDSVVNPKQQADGRHPRRRIRAFSVFHRGSHRHRRRDTGRSFVTIPAITGRFRIIEPGDIRGLWQAPEASSAPSSHGLQTGMILILREQSCTETDIVPKQMSTETVIEPK